MPNFDKKFLYTVKTARNTWELFDNITKYFPCVIVVGAGNHYGLTPTMGQIAQSDIELERFRIIRPTFDYIPIADHTFEDLLNDPFNQKIFENEINSEKVIFHKGFGKKYQVKSSFVGKLAFPAIRLDHKNSTCKINLAEKSSTDDYRRLLISFNGSAQLDYYYDDDFKSKYPESELQNKFLDHLKSDFPSKIIFHPLEYFYQTFDRPTVCWLNLNQDGLLERNIIHDRVVSYHGNIQSPKYDLVLPGHTGPTDAITGLNALRLINKSKVMIILGFSFSDYDADLLEALDRAKISHFLVFDLKPEVVYGTLKAAFPQATIIPCYTHLPLIPY